MSRISRVPYHQNVYDLLQIEPGESPEAARRIAEHEAQHGLLPASVREWYLVPNVVDPTEDLAVGTVWQTYSDGDWPLSLSEVLRQFGEASYTPGQGSVCVVDETQGVYSWRLELDGSDDPPVWNDDGAPSDRAEWYLVAATFSEFVADWFGGRYCRRWRARPGNAPQGPYGVHANGLWLRAPSEPFQPPVIDFLIDRFGEPERTPRAGNVTTYTYRPPGGTIRVTADQPALTGALSAWWVHAESPDRLAELAELLLSWGTLRETLRADTDPARKVLFRVHRA